MRGSAATTADTKGASSSRHVPRTGLSQGKERRAVISFTYRDDNVLL